MIRVNGHSLSKYAQGGDTPSKHCHTHSMLTVYLAVAGWPCNNFECPGLLCKSARHDFIVEVAPNDLLDAVDLPYRMECC